MNLVFVTLEEANRQCAIKESFIYKVIKRYSFKEICENILWAFRWFKNSPRLASLKHLPDYFVCYFFAAEFCHIATGTLPFLNNFTPVRRVSCSHKMPP